MSTNTPTTFCRSCGAPDLGTRFCESCGAPAAPATDHAQPVLAAAFPAAAITSSKGAPQVLYLLGIVGSSVMSVLATLATFSPFGQVAIPALDVATIVVDFGALAGLLALAARSSAAPALKVVGAILFLLIPAFDVVILVSDVAGSYGIYAYGVSTGFVAFALIAALAWLMVGRFAGRSYFLLFVVLGANLLAYPLQLVNGGSTFVLFSALRIAIVAAGLVVVVIVAPRIKRTVTARPAPVGVQAPMYAPAPGTSTTNGFAIAALVLGILGGTVLPIIFGHLAHSQIRRTGQAGWGLATAGLVLGYICTAVVLVILVVAVIAAVQAPRYY